MNGGRGKERGCFVKGEGKTFCSTFSNYKWCYGRVRGLSKRGKCCFDNFQARLYLFSLMS